MKITASEKIWLLERRVAIFAKNNPRVGVTTVNFLDKIKTLMERKGYKFSFYTQATLGYWRFEKPRITFQFQGYVGKRGYGNVPFITSLYINEKHDSDIFKMSNKKGIFKGFPVNFENMSDREWETYKKNLKHAYLYLKGLA